MSGLTTLADTAPSNDGEYFFVRNTDPVVVDNLLATTVITDELNLNGQAITADETAIFLNGQPYGGGGGGGAVDTVTGTAPITVTGTVSNPVVGIDLSNIVTRSGAQTITGAKKFGILPQSITGVLPTDPDEFTNKLYVDNTIETWSQFPATQDVNMNLFKIANCAEIANNTTGYGLTITSDQDINIEAATGNIDVTTTTMYIHNPVSMDGNKITDCALPTDPTDVATKAYVDSIGPTVPSLSQVMTVGNSSGSNNLNMNSNTISNVGNISMTGVVPTISAPLSATLTVAGLGPTTIASGTITTITAPTYVSIGSAGYTTIENLKITNSVIEKVPGQANLTIDNVSAISNTGANMAIGNNQILLNASGAVTVNSLNGTLSIQSGAGLIDIVGSTNISGNELNLSSGESITLDNSLSTTAPISLQTGTTENVCIQSGVPGAPLADSSILNVSSDSKGIYIPRMTAVQRDAITNPQNGLLVFDTTASALYMYGARGWAKVALTNSANELLESLSGLDGGVRTYSLTGLTEVDTLAVKTNTIQPLDPLIGTDVGVEAQLVWEGDILLKNNGNASGTDVIIDSIPAAPTSLGNVVSYDPTTKQLFYQAAGGGGGGAVNSVVAGTNIGVDSTDPANPVVSVDVQTDLNMNSNSLTLVSNISAAATADLNLNATTGGVNVTGRDFNIDISRGIKLNGAYGNQGYYMRSNGSSIPANWAPIARTTPYAQAYNMVAYDPATGELQAASNLVWDPTERTLF